MFTLKSAVIGAAMVAVLVGVSIHARANVPGANYLTFSQAVSLPGVTLPAGTYIFERAAENTPDIVRVMSSDRKKLYWMAFTISVPRPQKLGNKVVLFGEADPNVAPPIRAWFPIGENTGHQFNYER